MYKLSPRRNNRSKGIKVKHVLQVCVLLAICFWLIYQVKNSHDKKKEFDENDPELSIKSESSGELVKHGRKDLQPRKEEVATINGKHREEPEEETVGGKKPTEEEDREIIKAEDKNDEHGEGGEDEVDDDDHDKEKSDVEVDREGDFVDVDKERDEDDKRGTEEGDSEEDDGQVEDENPLEDHDHDEDSRSSHEAREENYKADDASSAVTHDTKLISAENENGNLKETTAHTEVNESNNSINNNSMQVITAQNTTESKVVDIENNGKRSSLNTTNSEEKGARNISSDALETLNFTRTEGFTDVSGLTNDLTEMGTETHELSPQNRTLAIPKEHIATVEETTSGGIKLSTTSQQVSNSADMVENNQTDTKLSLNTESEGVKATLVDSSNFSANIESSLVEQIVQGNASVGAVDNMGLPNKNATEDEKSYNSDDTGITDQRQDTSNSENLAEVQHDPIDTVDSSIHLEEKHVRTDLETLPEIQTEGSNSDDDVAK